MAVAAGRISTYVSSSERGQCNKALRWSKLAYLGWTARYMGWPTGWVGWCSKVMWG